VETSLGREATIWAAASKLCCGIRGFEIADAPRGRAGDGGAVDFVGFGLAAMDADAGASVRRDFMERFG